jgi:hypothetical protein
LVALCQIILTDKITLGLVAIRHKTRYKRLQIADAQIQPIRGIKKDQIALSQATKQRQCGTFVIRQGLEKMTPKEREEFFKSLERDGFLPEV